MATVGAAVEAPNIYKNRVVTISGIQGVGTTPIVVSWGFVIGSWQATGLAATGLTAALFGSNDGSHFYALNAGPATVDGIYGLTAENASTQGTTNVVPLYYQWTIAGTYTSGTLVLTVAMMSTFG